MRQEAEPCCNGKITNRQATTTDIQIFSYLLNEPDSIRIAQQAILQGFNSAVGKSVLMWAEMASGKTNSLPEVSARKVTLSYLWRHK